MSNPEIVRNSSICVVFNRHWCFSMFLAIWRRAKKEFCNFLRCFLCYEEVLKIVFSIFHTFSTVWWASQNIFWIYFSILETFLKRFWNQCFLLTAGCTLCSSISSSKSSFITLAKNDIIWPYSHMGRFFFGDVEPLSFLLTYFRCDFLSYFVRFLDLLAVKSIRTICRDPCTKHIQKSVKTSIFN